MNVYALSVGPFQVNCYFVVGPGGEALVVDPGAEAARLAAELQRRRLAVAAYLLTHGHVDHVSAVAELERRFPAPVLMHARDAAWAFQPANQMPPFYEVPEPPAAGTQPLSEGRTHELGGLGFRVLGTGAAGVLRLPGHLAGSLPAVLTLRVSAMNAFGKVYSVDKVHTLEP